MPNIHIRIKYDGKYRTCAELAAMTGDENITARHIYERLRTLNFPKSIEGKEAGRLLRPLGKPKGGRPGNSQVQLYTITDTGEKLTAAQIDNRFDVPMSTIIRLRKEKGQVEFSIEELVSKNRATKKCGTETGEWGRLSKYRNTGAGKGEIPDIEWINAKAHRRSTSTTHSLNLPR